MALDYLNIRKEFPILNEMVNGKPLVYLDNAATTQKPLTVLDSMYYAYTHFNSNIHRGVHSLSRKATEEHENARKKVASFINAASEREIIFTRGTTEAMNLLAWSLGELLPVGGTIVLSVLEHHSNIVPWQMLADRKKMKIEVIPLLQDGSVNILTLENILKQKPSLLSLAHVSNVMGIINPAKRIVELAHKYGVPVVLDGAQSVPHFKVDIQDVDADFLAFSAHKMYGPTGIGVLYGKEEWLKKMPPYQGGGEMIETVSFQGTTYNDLPFKFEAGTPDFIASVGLGAAIDFISSFYWNDMIKHEELLIQMATEGLKAIPGTKIIGDAKNKSGAVSFVIDKIHHFDLGTLLDQMGIAVRTGHHCAQPLMQYYNIEGTTRASFAIYNTPEEIEIFIKGVNRAVMLLRGN